MSGGSALSVHVLSDLAGCRIGHSRRNLGRPPSALQQMFEAVAHELALNGSSILRAAAAAQVVHAAESLLPPGLQEFKPLARDVLEFLGHHGARFEDGLHVDRDLIGGY